ncbi:MAG: DNA-processing protein DprA [Phycisphaerae bacterium]
MDTDERLAAVRLHLTPGVGPRLYAALLEHFGSARAAAEAPASALVEAPGIGRDTARRIRDGLPQADPEVELDLAARAGVRILVRGDVAYPPALAYLSVAPPVLYVKGTIEAEDAQAVTVVGTRRCSLYGSDQSERLAGGLARAGFTVVSGLARGIDSAAHRGALAAGGRTLAVLGNGLGTVYPPENARLAEAVVARGALVSEFPMAAEPAAENFPRRNRILAALGLGTVVVEAGRRSGALITARFAAELGKDVFAVPNRVDAPGAAGVHALLRDGAKLVESVTDILDEFPDLEVPSGAAGADEPHEATLALKANLSAEEGRLLEVLDGDPAGVDALAAGSGLEAARVSGALTLLELKGLVRALPGGRFIRRRQEA